MHMLDRPLDVHIGIREHDDGDEPRIYFPDALGCLPKPSDTPVHLAEIVFSERLPVQKKLPAAPCHAATMAFRLQQKYDAVGTDNEMINIAILETDVVENQISLIAQLRQKPGHMPLRQYPRRSLFLSHQPSTLARLKNLLMAVDDPSFTPIRRNTALSYNTAAPLNKKTLRKVVSNVKWREECLHSTQGFDRKTLHIIESPARVSFRPLTTKGNVMIDQLAPRSQSIYRALPVLGKIVDAFLAWAHRQKYTHSALLHYLGDIKWLDHFFRRRGIRSLGDLRDQHFDEALRHYRKERVERRGTVHQLRRFLVEQGILAVEDVTKSPSDHLIALFEKHLRSVRGLAQNTVVHHINRLRVFLRSLRFDSSPGALEQLRIKRVEVFLHNAARTNRPASLQQIVGFLRVFLRFLHAQGVIRQPLHFHINTPRVYRTETLPRAWALNDIQILLRSVDRSNAQGLRDFTIIYLAAAYGLRRRELARLTLDDIDWRNATLKITQTKNRQILRLPLTDEAGDILQQYLRRGRGPSTQRELFLRMYAPLGRLQPFCGRRDRRALFPHERLRHSFPWNARAPTFICSTSFATGCPNEDHRRHSGTSSCQEYWCLLAIVGRRICVP